MRKAVFCILSLSLLNCGLPKYPTKWKEKGIDQKESLLKVGESGKTMKILYTGCGGLALDNGGEVIATDPYFSHQPFMNIQLGKICTKPEAVEVGLNRFKQFDIDSRNIKHVLIAHSHYDHLMDVPYLLENHHLKDSVIIYGSISAKNIIDKFLPGERSFRSIEKETFYPKNEYIPTGEWIYLSQNIRILPIEAEHAPHFLNIELMHGEVGESGVPGFNRSTDKSKAKDWKRGKVFSFLIDYLTDEHIDLRLFIQSSSCQPPYGIPPKTELDKRKVDIAFVGVASTQNVKDYPETLIKSIEPKKVILIHWEDFFRPYGERAKTVRFTNFNEFFKRLTNAFQVNKVENLKEKVIMPQPGSLIKVEY